MHAQDMEEFPPLCRRWHYSRPTCIAKGEKHFGFFDITDGSKYTCLANACMLYDVLSGLVLYTVIAPCSFGEGTLMVTTPEWLLVQVAEFAG